MSSYYTGFILATIRIQPKPKPPSLSKDSEQIVSKLRTAQVLHRMSCALLDSVNLTTRL